MKSALSVSKSMRVWQRRDFFPATFLLLSLFFGACLPAGRPAAGRGAGMPSPSHERAKVLRVTDGDSFRSDIGEVRIVGIDAPEWGTCGSTGATLRLKTLIGGAAVTLKPDSQQPDRDKYDRLLRYILRDGTDVGAMLVEEGHAEAMDYFRYDRKGEYAELETEAQQNREGIWGLCFSE